MTLKHFKSHLKMSEYHLNYMQNIKTINIFEKAEQLSADSDTSFNAIMF